MATRSTAKTSTIVRTKPVLNLSTAKVADGAQRSSQSVYELCGISTNTYRVNTIKDYTRTIRAMNLIDLQDEAYKNGVLATDNRDILLDRLERKFIQESARFRQEPTPGSSQVSQSDSATRERALEILSRGR